MIVDARNLPADHEIHADVVIIGAGAAGITLACELEDSGLEVAVLESGGLSPEVSTARLNEGISSGLATPPLESTRLRYFGGTTGHWTGQCAPLDPIDFERRDWVPLSGWPLSRAELDPFYDRAGPYLGLGPMTGYDPATILPEVGGTELDLDGLFQATVYQNSPPTRFGTAYRDRLERASAVTVYLYANVTELLVDGSGGRLEGARCRTSGEAGFIARGGRFVLAAGGIENARILLASRSTHPRGVGNDRDVVGRYFMDHLGAPAVGRLVFGRPERVDATFFGFWQTDEVRGRGGLRPAPDTLRERRLLNAGLFLWPTPLNEAFRDGERADGVTAVVELVRALSSGSLPSDAWDTTCRAVADRREVFRFAFRRLRRTFGSPGGTIDAQLHLEAEQVPNPNSRVTLTREQDAFGVPRVELNWQATTQDLESIRSLLRLLGRGMGTTGLGRFRAEFPLDTGSPGIQTAYHHMGTTRMGTDRATSVVDADCRVHAVANLFVAGSSVFPTGGRSNPTFTIVALAIRLADHLRGGARS